MKPKNEKIPCEPFKTGHVSATGLQIDLHIALKNAPPCKGLKHFRKSYAEMYGIEEFYSYDKHYDRIDWLTRLET